jgi:hypothetical protein
MAWALLLWYVYLSLIGISSVYHTSSLQQCLVGQVMRLPTGEHEAAGTQRQRSELFKTLPDGLKF